MAGKHTDTNVVAMLWMPDGENALETLVEAGFSRLPKKPHEVLKRQHANDGQGNEFESKYLLVRDQGTKYFSGEQGAWVRELFDEEWGVTLPTTALSVLARADDSKEPLKLTEKQLDLVYGPLHHAGYCVFMVPGHERTFFAGNKPERLREHLEQGNFLRSTPGRLSDYAAKP
ncbi:MAG: hypothetical protein AABX51_07130 [Nanoarchaeota archaeon]